MAETQPTQQRAGDAATKTIVWKGPHNYLPEEFKLVGAMHARRVSPEDFGTAGTYLFTAEDQFAIEMPAADADAIMASASKGEFREKR